VASRQVASRQVAYPLAALLRALQRLPHRTLRYPYRLRVRLRVESLTAPQSRERSTELKSILLVGGEGTRLRPLTYTTPKQLLPVAGVPMIERVLERLHTASHGAGTPCVVSGGECSGISGGASVPAGGTEECILSMGYKPDRFRQKYADGIIADVKVSYVVESEPLGTGGAIRFAAARGGVSGTFVVMNGDVLGGPDIGHLLSFHDANRQHGVLATVGLVPVEDPSRFGVVVMNGSGQVQRFVEKPPKGQSPSHLVNGGIYIMEPEVLDMIPEGRMVSIERETFPALTGMGALYALSSDGYWLDAGTPETYLQANMDYLTRSYPARLSGGVDMDVSGGSRDSRDSEVAAGSGIPPLQDARRLEEGVWVVGNPVIEGKVLPPSLILDGSVIERGAVIAHAVIGGDCFVGTGCKVERSVVMDGTRIMQGTRIDSSVIAQNVEIGAGSEVSDWSVVGEGYTVAPGSVLSGARVPAY